MIITTFPSSPTEARAEHIMWPLSPEAAAYFVSDCFPLKSAGGAALCKFVRRGDTMAIAPLASYGKPDREGRPTNSIFHRDLVEFMRLLESNSVRNVEIPPEPALEKCPSINDAGLLVIFDDVVAISSDSFDFGRADENGRNITLAVAHKILGKSGYSVVLRD